MFQNFAFEIDTVGDLDVDNLGDRLGDAAGTVVPHCLSSSAWFYHLSGFVVACWFGTSLVPLNFLTPSEHGQLFDPD